MRLDPEKDANLIGRLYKEGKWMRLDPEKDANLIGRLYNFKFSSALGYIRDDHPQDIKDLVKALAEVYSNVGWFDGHSATIVHAALCSILPEEPEETNGGANS